MSIELNFSIEHEKCASKCLRLKFINQVSKLPNQNVKLATRSCTLSKIDTSTVIPKIVRLVRIASGQLLKKIFSD